MYAFCSTTRHIDWSQGNFEPFFKDEILFLSDTRLLHHPQTLQHIVPNDLCEHINIYCLGSTWVCMSCNHINISSIEEREHLKEVLEGSQKENNKLRK